MVAPRHAQVIEEGPPTLRVDGRVATITLRRPSQRNSLHDADLHTLLQHFVQLDADPDVQLLVLGAHSPGPRPVFCAGYHIGGFEQGTHGPQLFERIPDALEKLRPVTVCALGGSVYGGATDLVLACDLRVGLAGCEFRMPAAALGLHYYASGLRRYVTRMGLNDAKRAFLTAQALPFERLQVLGLFDALVAADAFDAAVDDLVQRLLALAPLALQATKRSLNEIAIADYEESRLRERERLSMHSDDFAEGRAAFAERRPPRFRGV